MLRANPAIASIFNRHLGDDFFPMLLDESGLPIVESGLAAMRGGGAMATRGLRWKDLVREKGAKWANKKAGAIAEDLGAYFSANPELAKGVAPGLAKAASASGIVDDETATAIKTVLSERISGRMMPKYLVDARRALDEARVARDRAKAAVDDFKASGGFRDQAKKAEGAGAESAEELAWRSRLRGQETEAGNFMRQLREPEDAALRRCRCCSRRRARCSPRRDRQPGDPEPRTEPRLSRGEDATHAPGGEGAPRDRPGERAAGRGVGAR